MLDTKITTIEYASLEIKYAIKHLKHESSAGEKAIVQAIWKGQLNSRKVPKSRDLYGSTFLSLVQITHFANPDIIMAMSIAANIAPLSN